MNEWKRRGKTNEKKTMFKEEGNSLLDSQKHVKENQTN